MKSAIRYWLILFRVLKVTQPSNSSLEPLDSIENPIIVDLAALLGEVRFVQWVWLRRSLIVQLFYFIYPVQSIRSPLGSILIADPHKSPTQVDVLLLLAYPSRRWSYENNSRCLPRRPRPWDIAPLVRFRLKTCRPLLVGILNLFFPKMNRFKFCE